MIQKLNFKVSEVSDIPNTDQIVLSIDFTVNHRSIKEILGEEVSNCIGVFNSLSSKTMIQSDVLRYSQKKNSELDSGRHILLLPMCCFDIGCGGVTFTIRAEYGCMVWSDFMFDDDVELEPIPGAEDVELRFDFVNYFSVMNRIPKAIF